MIIQKLTDANGKPAFTMADKPQMMRSGCPRVIARVAKEILMEIDPDEAEKN